MEISNLTVLSEMEISRKISLEAKRRIAEIGSTVGSIHYGGCFSVMDLLIGYMLDLVESKVAFEKFIEKNTLILSKGHCGLAYYSLLNVLGIVSNKAIESYCQDGGEFFGHIKKNPQLGIGWSTGSLGHGLSISIGIASAYKQLRNGKRVTCILGDGEMHEGSNWEALLHLSCNESLPLTVVLDNNKYLSLGSTKTIRPIEPIVEKIQSFKINVISIDGHNSSDIKQAFDFAKKNWLPTFINANTVKGNGVSFMEGNSEWHAKRATPEQLQSILKELKTV